MIAANTARRLQLGSRGVSAAVVLGLLATMTLVAQAYLLSMLIGGAVIHGVNFAARPALYAELVAVIVLRALLVGARETIAARAAARIKAPLRRRLFDHILALGPAHAQGERTGELAATATEGVERLDSYVSKYLPQRAFGMFVPSIIGLAVLWQDWISALMLLVTAPIIPVMMVLVGKFAESHTQAQWLGLTRLSAHFLDALRGLPTLQAFGRGAAARATIARVSMDYRDRTITVLRFAFLSGLVLEFISAGAIALVAVELGVRLLAGSVSFERAFFVLLLVPEYFRPLRELGQHRHAAMEGSASASRIVAILDTPAPASHAWRAAVPPAGEPPRIVFERVSFTYPRVPRPAISGVTLALAAGTRTALVGRSGSGKSTLLNLLLGFLEADEGTIAVDGAALSSYDRAAWRGRVALVPQRPHLFHASIRENIALGRPEATDDEIEWAAELAGAAGFVARLPERYHTAIGDGGTVLSWGEAQRIAIARAFLKDAPVLLLDEPSSSLDPTSEALVRDSLHRLTQGRTVLVVAHRLNTVYTADNIAVLAGGRLVEQGRHAELIALNGHYAALATAGRRASA